MATKSIPKDVKAKVADIIDRFNRDVLADDYRTYLARFKGNCLLAIGIPQAATHPETLYFLINRGS